MAPLRLGLSMEGNEESFFRHLKLIGGNAPSVFKYLEFGLAEGGTFGPVCRWLKEQSYPFCAVGVDLPDGWSLNMKQVEENLKGMSWTMGSDCPNEGIFVVLQDARQFLQSYNSVFDFVFIDACHGRTCAKSDFVAVSRYIRRGGIVAFHDTSEGCQGIHPQRHCGDTIQVRQALRELGLLNGELAGWRLLEETQGENGGHGMAFFQFEGY